MLCLLACAATASAEYTTALPELPPPSLLSDPAILYGFGAGNAVVVRNFQIHSDPVFIGGESGLVQSYCTVYMEMNLGSGWVAGTSLAAMQSTSFFEVSPLPDALYLVDFTLPELAGGTLPAGVRVRGVSGSGASSQTYDQESGLYSIDSFFDVFTELSIDNGGAWLECGAISFDEGQSWEDPAAIHTIGAPEPATLAFLSAGALALIKRRRR